MLAVRDLAVRFGGVAALDGVSFAVRPGSITSVIGPNGAGKTTAFNAITGYLRPAGGRVTYDGAPLTGLRPAAIARRGIVRTFQRTSVFPSLSVADNVMIGLHLRGTAGLLEVLAGRNPASPPTLPRSSSSSAWATDGARPRAVFRTASSGWWSWPWRSPPGRACCYSTSRERACRPPRRSA